jgi:hypothetical protein
MVGPTFPDAFKQKLHQVVASRWRRAAGKLLFDYPAVHQQDIAQILLYSATETIAEGLEECGFLDNGSTS